MRISDWSSDVCSSDLQDGARTPALAEQRCRFLGLPGTGRRAIAQKDGVGDKGAPRMVDADQRIVQDAPQRLDGTEVRVLAPGQIGEMTGGEPQPPLLLVVVVEQRIAPGHQDRKSTRLNSSH